jgi:NOL1/NOP2/fmu family ribosome biogenesis protein
MQHLRPLKSKEVKQLHSLLEKQFGLKKNLDYLFFINNKNKIYIIDRDFTKIYTEKLRISSLGLYFAEQNKSRLRLSIEGSELIGMHCTNNILDLDQEQARNWLKGLDLDLDIKKREFLLIKHKEDFLGCGKAVENKVLNYVPKNRRLRSSD